MGFVMNTYTTKRSTDQIPMYILCIWFIFITFYPIHLTNAEIIDTESMNEFTDTTIQCNENEECTIICDEMRGCQRAKFQCPPHKQCNIQCTGWQACEGATFYCPKNKQCNIICDGTNTCQNAIFQCPKQTKNGSCDITCDQNNACEASIMNATYSSSFNLRECRQGTNVCVGLTIYFPPYDTNTGKAKANITGDNSLSAGDPIQPLQFYAINGWKDVNVIDYIGNYQYHEGIMYCGSDYSDQCQFANNSFECAYPTDTCSNIQSLTTTPNPTTDIPTETPTKTPTQNPSRTPTFMPSESPTDVPSETPTYLCEPDVSLHGISTYSSTNLNLNGIVDIMSQIIFRNECRFKYGIIWHVFVSKLYTDDPTDIDNDKLNNLQTFLSDSMDMETISIDADSYLQSGLNYIFSISVEGNGLSIESTHELIFDYDDIRCQIATNDIFLDNVDPDIDLSDLIIEINGLLLTYDPIKYDTDDHLSWEWDCIDIDLISCNHILNSDTNAITYADFAGFTFDYLSFYSFTFTMHVIDNNNLYRPECIDSVHIEFTTKHNETNSVSTKLFIVSLTALQTEINVNDRLRLIGNIMNYDHLELLNEGIMEYQWIELNNLLSEDDIQKYKETSDNSSNLIIKENVLQSGEIYSFQLIVSQYTNINKKQKIGYGISTPITITTLQKPHVISGSFQIQPNCNIKYENINELISIPHTLSLLGDGEYIPLSYQFGYYYKNTKTKYYYHGMVLSDSCLSNIYLSIGDFTIFGNVIDSKSSMITENIECSITLNSYSICLDFYTDLIEPYIEIMSVSEKYKFILEKANIYMQYLTKYDGDNEECIAHALDGILTTIYNEIVDTEDALCFTMYPILLSQTISSWMDLVSLNKKTAFTFYKSKTSETLMQIKTLLFATLDSCLYVTDNITSVEELTVSEESIITKIPKIYYEQEDITYYLSPIISKTQYHDLLYVLASSMINMFEYLSNKDSNDLYNLLSDALYISELIRISLSIPGENRFIEFDGVSIYSVRVNNEDVNVSVSNISVFIPRDITNRNDKTTQLFDSIDILVVGMNTSANNVSTIISEPDANCNNVEGELSENSISITIVGNHTNTSHLPSNIDFTFACDENIGCDKTFECVWYNQQYNIWQNDGCFTIIDDKNKEIRCQCSHLTTFATIHNIHSSECDNDYLQEWILSTEWDYMNLVIGIIFLLICIHSIYEIHPFFRVLKRISWRTHRAVLAVLLIGITSFLYVLVCIQAYITKTDFNIANIKIYSFLLLLPQISLFLLFSMIFYTWFTLAHGFLNNLHEIKQRLRMILIIINISICVVLLTYYFISFVSTQYIFKIGTYVWATVLSITTIAITTYAFIVGKQLYYAHKISQNQSFGKDDWKIVRRLLITNTFITFYFIFQCITAIYLSIDSEYQSVMYSLIYAFIDALCLLFIYWMYQTSLHHLVEKIDHEKYISDNLKIRRVKSDTNSTANVSNTNDNSSHSHTGHTIDLERKRTSTITITMPNRTAVLSRIQSDSVYSNSGSSLKPDNSPKYSPKYSPQVNTLSPTPNNTVSSLTLSPLSPPSSTHQQTQFKYKMYKSDINNRISEDHSDIEIVCDDCDNVEMSTMPPQLEKNHSITEYEPEKVLQIKKRVFNNNNSNKHSETEKDNQLKHRTFKADKLSDTKMENILELTPNDSHRL